MDLLVGWYTFTPGPSRDYGAFPSSALPSNSILCALFQPVMSPWRFYRKRANSSAIRCFYCFFNCSFYPGSVPTSLPGLSRTKSHPRTRRTPIDTISRTNALFQRFKTTFSMMNEDINETETADTLWGTWQLHESSHYTFLEWMLYSHEETELVGRAYDTYL